MFEVQQTTSGDWAVVVAAGRALVVARTDRESLVRYLDAVRVGFAETLDQLIADGLGRTPAFGLLDVSGDTGMLAVRGGLRAAVTDGTGTRDLRAAVSSWLETQLDGATTVTLGSPAGETLPLADGIVRGGALIWTAAGAAAEQQAVPGLAKQGRITEPVILEPVMVEPVIVEPVILEPLDEPTRVPEPTITEVTRVSEPTIAEAPDREAADRGAVGSGTPGAGAPDDDAPAEAADREEPAGETGYDHLFGATMMRGIEEAAMRSEPAAAEPARIDLPGFITDSFPSASAVGDHDGLTVFSGDLPARAPAAAPDPGEEETAAPAPLRYSVVLSDGRREQLVAPLIVGRAPSTSAFRALTGARPLTLTGVEEDISRSHVAVAVEGDTVVVTDLHSRNGTIVVLPGKAPQKLRAGEPTTVVAGTLVDLGSGATLTVEAGA